MAGPTRGNGKWAMANAAIAFSMALALLLTGVPTALGYTQAQASSAISDIEFIIPKMEEAGLGHNRVSRLLDESYSAYGSKEYQRIMENLGLARNISSLAFGVRDGSHEISAALAVAVMRNLTFRSSDPQRIAWGLDYITKESAIENYEGAHDTLVKLREELNEDIRRVYSGTGQDMESNIRLAEKNGVGTAKLQLEKKLYEDSLLAGNILYLEGVREEAEKAKLSLELIEKNRNGSAVLSGLGFSTRRIDDELEYARRYLSSADYDSALESLKSTEAVIQSALGTKGGIDRLRESIAESRQSLRIELDGPSEKAQEAEAALSSGNYEDAGRMLEAARAEAEKQISDQTLKQAKEEPSGSTLGSLARRHLWKIALAAAALAGAGFYINAKYRKELENFLLRRAKKRITVAQRQVQELQRDYFVRRNMSREQYDDQYESKQEEIMKLKERIMAGERRGSNAKKRPGTAGARA